MNKPAEATTEIAMTNEPKPQFVPEPITFTVNEIIAAQKTGENIYQQRVAAMYEAIDRDAARAREREAAGLPTQSLDGVFYYAKDRA